MKINFISLCIVNIAIILFFSGICTADHAGLIQIVKQSLPAKWKIEEVKENIKPYWSLSEATCTKIMLVGPKKSGYRFYDKDGALITEHLSHSEAIILWIADKNFDHGWNILQVIKNRFNLFPIDRPSQLHDGAFKAFGAEDFFIFDTTYSKDSPPGTLSARFKKIKRSWPSWKRDLKKIFKKAQQENPPDAKSRAGDLNVMRLKNE